jgi:hypothetical protein
MITFIMDLKNKVLHASGEATSSDVTVEFYLDMDPVATPFKNFGHSFSFKGLGAYTVGDQDARVVIEADPPEDIQADEAEGPTEFPFLVERHFIKNLYPEEEYEIEVTFKNRREVFTDSYFFTVPRPPKPYDSWIWSSENKEWVAPAEPPALIWDESSQQWIIP